jgi:hypothetical protein
MMADFLTRADVDAFGSELVDFAQRAAAHALSPHLQNLEQQQAVLAERLRIEAKHRLDQQVAAAVPDYASIDRDPRWHQWLRGTDALNNRVRQALLNDAVNRADAHSIIAIFRSFMREGGGSASGQSSATAERSARPSGQRTYTRDQIAQLYSAHRKGLLTGPAWERQEQDIFAAQRENRIFDVPYLTK